MPTGYTCILDESDKSTAKWVIEDLVRAFGFCMRLRDDDSGLSRDKILEKLGKIDNYYKEELDEAIKECKQRKAMTDEEWAKEMEEYNKQVLEQEKKRKAECDRLKKIHDRAYEDLKKLRDKTSSEVTEKVAQFGIEQLSRVQSETEYEPYDREQHDLEAFKQERIQNSEWGVEYNTGKWKEEMENARQRKKVYLEVEAEVEEILGEPAS